MSETKADNGKWGDLNIRLASGACMAFVGLAAIIIGGVWFDILLVFVTGLMIWELSIVCNPDKPNAAVVLGVLAGSLLSAQTGMAGWQQAILFAVVPFIGLLVHRQRPVLFAVFAVSIGLATFSLSHFRDEFGASWILWVILVIIASDTLGYLVGRLVGGAKFWPKVSPKKTWSGTVAGWIGAAIVGAMFVSSTNAGPVLIVVSVAIAFAGQMGDIAESALKRNVGVKDSSDLIPGHGGILDRFDAMLGAFLVLGVLVFLGVGGVTF